MAGGGFSPPLSVRDFAIGHIARGVTSQFANFVSQGLPGSSYTDLALSIEWGRSRGWLNIGAEC
jgi:hypothetical protein